MPTWMKDDDIPFQHFSGSGQPKHMQCTCKEAPTRYCWVHKGYAAPSRAECPEDNDSGPDLWAGYDGGYPV